MQTASISETSPAYHDWNSFWQVVAIRLRSAGYAEGSRQQYRYILRSFYRFCQCAPQEVTTSTVRDYLWHLADHHMSSAWMGMTISVLRNAFDRVWDNDITCRIRTPRRPHRLPEILTEPQIKALLSSSDTLRGQLILGLLYGCGLKPGEVSILCWRDINTAEGYIRLPAPAKRHAGGINAGGINAGGRNSPEETPLRDIPLPSQLLPVLEAGKTQCASGDYLFPGRTANTPLSRRMIERTVRTAAEAAGLGTTVSAMTLRHTFAVHCLRKGWSIRRLQVVLGHHCISSTILYKECTPPINECPGALSLLHSDDQSSPAETNDQGIDIPCLTDVATLQLPFSSGPHAWNFTRRLATRVRTGLFRSRAAAAP